ncbi:hypothetical protein [Hydrocarboniphaga sp.]|uniref:hypothetical protein n=1 Tax=Hydrocarboniphaga sp. TaxID=2033016 RepID=UPI003D113721
MKTKPPSMIHLAAFAASLLLCACSDSMGHPEGISVPPAAREVHCAPDASVVASNAQTVIANVACNEQPGERS